MFIWNVYDIINVSDNSVKKMIWLYQTQVISNTK